MKKNGFKKLHNIQQHIFKVRQTIKNTIEYNKEGKN